MYGLELSEWKSFVSSGMLLIHIARIYYLGGLLVKSDLN